MKSSALMIAMLYAATSSLALAAVPMRPVHVKIGQENKSGETGTATLTPEGDGTRVVISLNGAPQGVAQPAHIHQGTCKKLNPQPKYGLENVVDGKSTTVVPVSEKVLLASKHLAINVHKSADDLKTYVACGNINASTRTRR
ncbi:MAG TPA: hypothetical protein VFX09_04970 [Burkholderiales bacterium]|nr:hypothetical protein [Burkholderiales bacterium]